MACRVLLDEQIIGFAGYFRMLAYTEEWRSISEGIELEFLTFADRELPTGSSDRVVWLHCQEHGLYLLTDNRNEDGDDSLGVVLQSLNGPNSLPVFTIGSRDRLANDRVYGKRLIAQLLDYLFDPEKLLGVGRMYLP